MSERFLTRSGILLFLFRTKGTEQEILLQKRSRTGYMDEMWDCAAVGHVDKDESLKMAVAREAREELGINIENVSFATLMHKYEPSSGNTYFNAYFIAGSYVGIPSIKEPEKCIDLRWFNINDLPIDFINERKQAFQNYLSGIAYDEYGWNDI